MNNLKTSNWTNSSILPDTIPQDENFQLKFVEYCTKRDTYAREHNLKLYGYYNYGVDNLTITNFPINVYYSNGNFYCVTDDFNKEPIFYTFENEYILERFMDIEQFPKYFVDYSNIVSNNTKY